MAKEIIAAGGLVTNQKGELLMIFRRGKWDLPKGKLDEGERIEECALREVEEETGLQNINRGKLIDITIHYYEEEGGQIIKKTYWYEMSINGHQALKPQTEEGISEAKWVSKATIDDCLANTYENIRQIIAKSGWLQRW